MTFSKYFQFLISELNKNKSTITKVFFSIFISLSIFSSVTILKSSIENEIRNNSRLLLGGDLELSTKNNPLNYNFLEKFKSDCFVFRDVDVVVCRFYAICECLVNSDACRELLVPENSKPFL